MRLGMTLADGFHREVEHDFVAATVRFFGDVNGVRIVGEDGDGERVGKSEDGFGSGIILAEVVENDREARSGGYVRSEFDGGNRGFSDVNCVRRDFATEIFEGESVAVFDRAGSREFVACRNIIESLEDQGFVGALCCFGSRRAKSDVDAIGAALSFVRCVERGASGCVERAFGFGCVGEFVRDRVDFRCGERF